MVEADLFRSVLRSWATGVTIVTSRAGDRVQGMTVSAFSSVSVEPPMVLVCADKASITNGLIEASGVFSVSILAQGQEDLSNRFASKRDEHRRFEGLDCEDGHTGCPRIPGAVGWLDCKVDHPVDAGDHFVYIARVQAAEITEREPLVYCRHRYGKLD